MDHADTAICLYIRKLPAPVWRSLRCRGLLQQLNDVGDCGSGSAAVEFLRRDVVAKGPRRTQTFWRRLAQIVVAFSVGSVGAAGNCRGRLSGRGLRKSRIVVGLVCACWHFLDPARSLFSAVYAAGRKGSPG